MTSESEGLPMSMIEAMSCKLPVVVPKINDLVDDENKSTSGLPFAIRLSRTFIRKWNFS